MPLDEGSIHHIDRCYFRSSYSSYILQLYFNNIGVEEN